MEHIYSAQGFIKITNIGDVVHINFNGSETRGTVTAISWRGVTVRVENGGTYFYKWCHIRKLVKQQVTII